MALTLGSLFSGCGGLDLGLERAGMRVVWQCEIDDYATRVLERHWPDAKRYRDVRDIDATAARVDVICGGFPCVNISNAGKKEGIDGEHSGLWREYARIVGLLRPRFVVVENVAALVARGLDRVLGDLAALGYDASWSCVSACAVGATHSRERLFLVVYSDGDSESARAIDEEVARLPAYAGALRDGWAAEPRTLRMAHGFPHGMDRLRLMGNAVVPALAELVGRVVVEAA